MIPLVCFIIGRTFSCYMVYRFILKPLMKSAKLHWTARNEPVPSVKLSHKQATTEDVDKFLHNNSELMDDLAK